MNREMVLVEFLTLRKRRALFWWTLFLTVGALALFFSVTEVLHLVSPQKYGAVGGIHGLQNALGSLSSFGACAGILIGATAGSEDVASGVFRDLVSTGHSRLGLFSARVPAVLTLLVPMIVAGFAVASVFILGFGGTGASVGAWLLIRSLGWALLASGVPALVALGVSSLADNRGIVVGVAIAWIFVAEPLLNGATALGPARAGLLTIALGRMLPLTNGVVPPELHLPIATAALVLAGWVALALVLGGRRTVTRDA